MRVVTTAEMREADRRCIEELGIPGAVLMNNAGSAVFAEVGPGTVGVVCGKGNNGGDGFVVARLALLAGRDVTTVLLAPVEDVRGDARTFLDAYVRLGGRLIVAPDGALAEAAVAALAGRDTLIDAVLGTGISGAVRGAAAGAIEGWPVGSRTVAVDIPSGLDSDAGTPCGACVRAETTVTFQFAKSGVLADGAVDFVGTLIVADIGIPEICADDVAWAALKKDWI